VLWASANRDEAVFGDPDAFEPIANRRHNLVYGRGLHYCPRRQTWPDLSYECS
jgi:cytochrome P450